MKDIKMTKQEALKQLESFQLALNAVEHDHKFIQIGESVFPIFRLACLYISKVEEGNYAIKAELFPVGDA